MDILLVSGDLTTNATVTGAAQRQNLSLVVALHVDGMIESLKSDPAKLVILDMGSISDDPAHIVARLRDLHTPPTRMAAFGPHVHQERLDAARAAGFDHVLSRGAFFSQMDEIVALGLGH
jgi:hypothetical protein